MRGAFPFAVGLVALAPLGCLLSFEEEAPTEGPGLDALVRLDEEPAGERCPAGGVILVAGTDLDRDGALSSDEEGAAQSVLCAAKEGASGRVVLLRIASEPPGEACAHGGQRVESGVDGNRNDALDDDEVEAVRYLCNAAPGFGGGQALVEVHEEPPGESCPRGGARVVSGIDQNGDGVLDEGEIATITYACHGLEGGVGADGKDGSDALVDVVAEPPGAACPAGGQRVSVGHDENGDGVLSEDERTSTSYVCHGRGLSSGGGGELSGGEAEGTSAAPIELTVGSFARALSSHEGRVGATLSSYYRFTTLSDPVSDLSAPYTLAFHDMSADAVVTVYAEADFATGAQPVECRFDAPRRFVCATGVLVDGDTYYVRVQEARNIALEYTLTVSFGADTGTAAAPATPASAVSVSGGGRSIFAVGGAPGEVKTVRLVDVRGAPGKLPALVWDQLDDGENAAPYGTCSSSVGGEIACPTARLRAGTLIAVRDTAGEGALFDLVVEDGDTLTPLLPLESLEEVPSPVGERPIVAFPTSGAGVYTLAWYRAPGALEAPLTVELFPDRLSLEANERRVIACNHGVCLPSLPAELASGFVYARLPARSSGDELPHQLALYPRGGARGALGDPVPLPLGLVVKSSTGGFGRPSYYELPPPTGEVRYAVRVDTELVGPLNCRWSASAAFRTSDYLTPSQTAVETTGCVSEPLPAGVPVFLSVNASSALVYTLEAFEGDPITPLLPSGEGPQIVVGTGATVYRRFETPRPGPYAIATTTTGAVQRRIFPGFPSNFSQTQDIVRCEGSSGGATSSAPCTLRFVAKASVESHYLRLIPSAHTITLEPLEIPVHEHMMGSPTPYTLPAGESLWFEVEIPNEGDYELEITQSAHGSYVLRGYSPGYLTNPIIHSRSGPAGTFAFARETLTPGRWAFELQSNGSSDLELTLDVREVP